MVAEVCCNLAVLKQPLAFKIMCSHTKIGLPHLKGGLSAVNWKKKQSCTCRKLTKKNAVIAVANLLQCRTWVAVQQFHRSIGGWGSPPIS